MADVAFRKRIARLAARFLRWLTHRLYNELAWAYDPVAWLVSLGRWAQWRRLALAHLPGRVLELGFGTGELLLEMRRRGIAAVGLELSPAMHRVTARKLRCRGLSAPRVRADAQAMPFADASFDAVVATFPAEYILRPEVMAEARRVLRPGLPLVVAGLYVESDSPLLRLLAWLVSGDAHRAEDRFRQAAESAGLGVEQVTECGRGFRLPVFLLRPRQTAPGEADSDSG